MLHGDVHMLHGDVHVLYGDVHVLYGVVPVFHFRFILRIVVVVVARIAGGRV